MKPFKASITDLKDEIKTKVVDTARYSLRQDPSQNRAEVVKRCAIAIVAEHAVADWLDGYVSHGDEDTSDPYTFAWDVLAHPKYCGLRVEVKTHQSDAKWISVTTGYSGIAPGGFGINIGPFLNHYVADIMIIFDTTESDGFITFTPKFVGDRAELERVTKRSNFSGWYLQI